ncbi:hypothetical protein LK540_17150 [Massilia sp. IC2-278]|uniref:hypothetical protein n=1 Tax=Massilia sp. IC2-278 TaxID=2887200 RepID=UPI001E3462DC|nr:hypothetical protein [Massilia sp. IC2-278]MCC2962158.1 hypothetical protein [Massilia sp. IC2-278]
MEIVTTMLLMIFLLYQFYAAPIGMLFVFLLTRHLLKSHAPGTVAGIVFVWTMAIFTPLVTPARSMFPDIYSPWYLALLMSPPAPEFRLAPLVMTVMIALASISVAVIVNRK